MTVTQGLKISYRKGRPFAAYLCLQHDTSVSVSHSRRFESGVVADFSEDGRCTGLELTAPSMVTLEAVNGVLKQVGRSPVTAEDLRPLVNSTAA